MERNRLSQRKGGRDGEGSWPCSKKRAAGRSCPPPKKIESATAMVITRGPKTGCSSHDGDGSVAARCIQQRSAKDGGAGREMANGHWLQLRTQGGSHLLPWHFVPVLPSLV